MELFIAFFVPLCELLGNLNMFFPPIIGIPFSDMQDLIISKTDANLLGGHDFLALGVNQLLPVAHLL